MADGKTVKLTHLNKMFWPKEKYTKGDLLKYYESIAPFIVPLLKNRPVMLHRYPSGIHKPGFYQKGLEHCPPWVKTVRIKHESRTVSYPLVQNKATLLYLVNLGCIDFHPFLSTCLRLKNPNCLVFDLDPRGISFDAVIEVAKALHEVLNKKKMKNLCKTSGGKGLHIFIPLRRRLSFDEAKELAKSIAMEVQEKLPRLVSLKRDPNQKGKVYIDCLRNAWAQTAVSAYSVRPRPGAPVSTPLQWKEVKKGLDPLNFTIKTVPKRVKRLGNLFKGI